MKTVKKSTAKKLLIRFDNELRDLLLNDLMSFATKNPFAISNNQALVPSTLSIA